MGHLLFIFTIVSGLAFVLYGGLCVFSDHMKIEFERYGLLRFRKLVGVVEFLGGLGLFVGLFSSKILIFSASGLALLMVLGLGVRLRVKDGLIQMAPAAVLLVVNAAIVWMVVQ
jgi:hypothetical protein